MLQRIHNGRDPKSGKTQHVEVVRRHLPGKKLCKPPEAKPAIRRSGPGQRHGSRNERVVFFLTREADENERKLLHDKLRQHDCYSLVHAIRWQQPAKVIVIEVKRRHLRELAHIDVSKMLDDCLHDMPVTFVK